MYYGGFGSMSYSTSEEPSNLQLEASKCAALLMKCVTYLCGV